MTHTSGPWVMYPETDGQEIYAVDMVPGLPIRGLIVRMPTHATNWLANARLIAAAPDLLEALKEARDYVRQDLKNIGPCEHDVGHCVCGILSMLHRMEEAIARAEGRS